MKEKIPSTSSTQTDARMSSQKSIDAIYPKKAPISTLNRMKLKYLAQRPKHEYAICGGELKKADQKLTILAKNQLDNLAITTSDSPKAASKITPSGMTTPSPKSGKSLKNSKASRLFQPAASDDFQVKSLPMSKKKGNQADKPLINGIPFWFVVKEQDEEEETDVENSIDNEFIKSVLDSSVTLRPKPIPEHTDLDPLGSITVIKNYCGYYNEDNVIHATVLNAVLDASSQNLTKRIQRSPLKVTWEKKVKVIELNLDTREIIGRKLKQLTEPKTLGGEILRNCSSCLT